MTLLFIEEINEPIFFSLKPVTKVLFIEEINTETFMNAANSLNPNQFVKGTVYTGYRVPSARNVFAYPQGCIWKSYNIYSTISSSVDGTFALSIPDNANRLYTIVCEGINGENDLIFTNVNVAQTSLL